MSLYSASLYVFVTDQVCLLLFLLNGHPCIQLEITQGCKNKVLMTMKNKIKYLGKSIQVRAQNAGYIALKQGTVS